MNKKLADKCVKADFEKIFKHKGYSYFTKGDYNLNIIGIRSNQNNKVTNVYDDILVVTYKINGEWNRNVYSITTEPGKKMMLAPSNSKGTAILVPGQYKGVYKVDLHNGKYKALCQRNGSIKVYRDNNKDLVYDLNPKKVDTGWFGINIHRSNKDFTRATVDAYSAGCQSFDDPNQFDRFMKIVEKSKAIFGNKFTYTLINEEDLDER